MKADDAIILSLGYARAKRIGILDLYKRAMNRSHTRADGTPLYPEVEV